MKPQSKRTKSY